MPLRAAGATCLLHYFDDPAGENRKRRREPRRGLATASGVKVHLFAADVQSSTAVEEMMQSIQKAVGGIDILVDQAADPS